MINKTLCEHCIFKVMGPNTANLLVGEIQNGCLLGRLDKLPHHMEDNFAVIDTYCSTCRNVYWQAAHHGKSNTELIDIVMDEVKIQYDVIIVFDDSDDTRESLKHTIEQIIVKKYQPSKVFVVMSLNRNNEILSKELARELSKQYNFSLSIETEIPLKLRPVIQKSTAGYLLFVNPGHDYDESVINDFNTSVNIDNRPKILYASEEFYVCPKFLYSHFMYEDSPFEKINEYVKSVTSDKRVDSEL